MTSSLLDWSVHDVETWLRDWLSEAQFKEACEMSLNLTGPDLVEMDSEAWKELGVSSAIERCKLMAAVKATAAGRPVPAPQRQLSSTSPTNDKQLTGDQAAAAPPIDITVKCRCTIQKLTVKNLSNSEFQAFLKFEALWEDRSAALQELHSKVPSPNLFNTFIDDAKSSRSKLALTTNATGASPFAPRLTFTNCMATEELKEWYSLHDWTPGNPTVRWFSHFTGTFALNDLSLRKFPLDEQMLTVEVQSGHVWDSGGSRGRGDKYRARLVMNNTPTSGASVISRSTISFQMKNQFRLTPALYFDEMVSCSRDSSAGHTYSQLLISMHVRRRSWYCACRASLARPPTTPALTRPAVMAALTRTTPCAAH